MPWLIGSHSDIRRPNCAMWGRMATPDKNWGEDLCKMLVEERSKVCSGEQFKYDTLMKNLRWRKIHLGGFSPFGCQEKSIMITKGIRRYWIFDEVVQDVKQNTENLFHVKASSTEEEKFDQTDKKVEDDNKEILI